MALDAGRTPRLRGMGRSNGSPPHTRQGKWMPPAERCNAGMSYAARGREHGSTRGATPTGNIAGRSNAPQRETARVKGLPTCASPSRLHRLGRQGDMPVCRTPAREWRGLQRQRARTLQGGTPREDRVTAVPRPPLPATSDGRRIPRNQKGYAVRGTV